MPSSTKLLSLGEVADRLGVHAITVKRWARDGVLPTIKVSDRVRRVDPDDLVRFIDARRECGR